MKFKQGQLDKKGGERVNHIGKAATMLFHKKGYLEASMDDIAHAAMMSKGGVYHYFASKDEILYFILNNYMDIILGDLEEELKEIEKAHLKIQFVISRHIEIYTKHISESKTLLHEAHCLPSKYLDIIAEKERKYYRIVADVLSGFFENQIQKDKLIGITFLLFGMCNGIYFWYNPKGPLDPTELSDIIFNMFLHGLNTFK